VLRPLGAQVASELNATDNMPPYSLQRSGATYASRMPSSSSAPGTSHTTAPLLCTPSNAGSTWTTSAANGALPATVQGATQEMPTTTTSPGSSSTPAGATTRGTGGRARSFLTSIKRSWVIARCIARLGSGIGIALWTRKIRLIPGVGRRGWR